MGVLTRQPVPPAGQATPQSYRQVQALRNRPGQPPAAGAAEPPGGSGLDRLQGALLEPLQALAVPGVQEVEKRLQACEQLARAVPQMMEAIRAAERRAQAAEAMAANAAQGVGGRAEILEKSITALGQGLIHAENQLSDLRIKLEGSERQNNENKLVIGRLEHELEQDRKVHGKELKFKDEQSAALAEEARGQVANVREEFLLMAGQMEKVAAEAKKVQGDVQLAVQRLESKIVNDGDFVDKIKELGVENVNVTAENFVRVNSRIVDLETSLSVLSNKLGEEKGKREEAEKTTQLLVKEVESGVMAAEAKILRRTIALLESRSKELLRKCESTEAHAEDLDIAAKAIVADQWHVFSKKDALDKRTTIERLLMIEKAILEEHDGRIASEHILRNLVEKQNDDYINAVHKLRAGVEEREIRLRNQITEALAKTRTFVRDLEENVDRERHNLEEIVKVEIAARMKACKALKDQMQLASLSGQDRLDGNVTAITQRLQKMDERFKSFAEATTRGLTNLQEDVADGSTQAMMHEVAFTEELGALSERLDETYNYQSKRHYEDRHNLEAQLGTLRKDLTALDVREGQDHAESMRRDDALGQQLGAAEQRVADNRVGIDTNAKAIQALDKGLKKEAFDRADGIKGLEGQMEDLVSDLLLQSETVALEIDERHAEVKQEVADHQKKSDAAYAEVTRQVTEISGATSTARSYDQMLKDLGEGLASTQGEVRNLATTVAERIDDLTTEVGTVGALGAETRKALGEAEGELGKRIDFERLHMEGEVAAVASELKVSEEATRLESREEFAKVGARLDGLQRDVTSVDDKASAKIAELLSTGREADEKLKFDFQDSIGTLVLSVESYKNITNSNIKTLENHVYTKTGAVQQNMEAEFLSFKHLVEANLKTMKDELDTSIADSQLFEELIAMQFDEQKETVPLQIREKATAIARQIDNTQKDFGLMLQKVEDKFDRVQKEFQQSVQGEGEDRKVSFARIEQRLEDLIRSETDERKEHLEQVRVQYRDFKEDHDTKHERTGEQLAQLEGVVAAEAAARREAMEGEAASREGSLEAAKAEILRAVEDTRGKADSELTDLKDVMESRQAAESNLRQEMEATIRSELIAEFANRERMVAALGAELRNELASKEQAEAVRADVAGLRDQVALQEAVDERLAALATKAEVEALAGGVEALRADCYEGSADSVQAIARAEVDGLRAEVVEVALPTAVAALEEKVGKLAASEELDVLKEDLNERLTRVNEGLTKVADETVKTADFEALNALSAELKQSSGGLAEALAACAKQADVDALAAELRANATEAADASAAEVGRLQDAVADCALAADVQGELAAVNRSLESLTADILTDLAAESSAKAGFEDQVAGLADAKADRTAVEALTRQLGALEAGAASKADLERLGGDVAAQRAAADPFAGQLSDLNGVLAALKDETHAALEGLRGVMEAKIEETDKAKAVELRELQAALEGLEDRAASREEIKQFEATLAGLYARKGDVDADVRGVRDALATAVEQGAKRGDLEALKAQLQLFMYSPEMQQAQRVGTEEIARMQERLEVMARQQDEMARKQEEAHGLTPRLVEDQTRDQVAALRGEYLTLGGAEELRKSILDVNSGTKLELSKLYDSLKANPSKGDLDAAKEDLMKAARASVEQSQRAMREEFKALLDGADQVTAATDGVARLERALEEQASASRKSIAEVQLRLEAMKTAVTKATYEGSLSRQLDVIGEKFRAQTKETEALVAKYREEVKEKLAGVPSAEVMREGVTNKLQEIEETSKKNLEFYASNIQKLQETIAENSKTQAQAVQNQSERDSGLQREIANIQESLSALVTLNQQLQ